MFDLQNGPIDAAAVRRAVSDPRFGAILVFEGVTRNNFDGRQVTQLAYEAYPEMAIPALKAIGQKIAERWPGAKCAIVHRLGICPVEEASVVIAVGTPHRPACYEASRFALEELKAQVPIWKKEIYDDGSAWKANTSA